jgi:hypothetical protein
MTASHIHIIYIGSVWAHWDAVDELMGTSLQCSGSDHEPGFYENLKSEGEQWFWCHDVMVEAANHPWLHLTFKLYKLEVFEHIEILSLWFCGWAHGCILTVLCLQWPWTWTLLILTHCGCECEWKWCRDVMVVMANPADWIQLSHYILKVCEHVEMLWMSSLVYHYSVTPTTVCITASWDFSKDVQGDSELKW